MKNKHFGFTLIELLVVIVIIGILATISTATFKSYFGKARDAARNTTVANITLMMKVDGADNWQDSKYMYTADGADDTVSLQELFDDNDYKGPKGENDICYFIGMSTGAQPVGDDNQFVVATYGEETSSEDVTEGGVIVDGTSSAVDNMKNNQSLRPSDVAKALFSCDGVGMGTLSTYFLGTVGTAETNTVLKDLSAVGADGYTSYLWIGEDGGINAGS